MPGLPFGAARQHPVPAEVLDYEHIVKIEFIEIDADRPYPRSVAYRPTPSGSELRVRKNAPEVYDVALDEPQSHAYIVGLIEAGLFAWQRVYRPAQGTFVLAGTEWRIDVEFETPQGLKRVHPFKAEGENTSPDNYEAVVSALMNVPLPPCELLDSDELAESEDAGGAESDAWE